VDNSEIKDNDYALSVTGYVQAEEIDNSIDIHELNAEITEIVAREDQLRADIEAIIAEIEGNNHDG
jgi:type I restriction enzyme M protein